ncbi:porin [Flavobacterium sp. Sd200]|uniref:porin n=1 Tax=Flavobacterium sp. Sd200 TaxID=2692211 RepID=UPI00136CE774|nr:porin [Flavobacterium sp. Sd200]MXN90465.1 porin [Flavobacterium sp. Sd200]
MKKLSIIAGLLLFSWTGFSQGSSEYGSGLKFNLDSTGTKYMRAIVWNQIWFRSSEMNPGTMINGEAATSSTDIGSRRLRMLLYAQISKRYMVLAHFGINNQTFTNGGAASTVGTGGYGAAKKPGIFFHDAWNEYAVILPGESGKFSLSLGGGLHYYMGLSRMTMSSTLNYLAADAPIFNWPLIENSDQFARQMGLFAKGKYGKFEYRLSYNKPFATNINVLETNTGGGYVRPEGVAYDNSGNTKWSKAGYFEYQFLETESNLLPYKVGSYVGTKKVFNVGAGFYMAPDGTRSRNAAGTQDKHDINLFAGDVFLDMPIGTKKAAITAYSVFYSYDFGSNYLRDLGIMNVGVPDAGFTGTRALAGAGNAQPTIGSGTIWYTQAGYLIPDSSEKPKVRVQPFGAFTHKNFDALDKASAQFDIGSNFYIDGHHAKITTQYSTRPVYTTPSSSSLKGEFLVQLQIYL